MAYKSYRPEDFEAVVTKHESRLYRTAFDNPIFLIDELTLDAVLARTYEVSDSGDEPGQRMKFSVLYGDVLVELNAKGVSSEVIFEILQQLLM